MGDFEVLAFAPGRRLVLLIETPGESDYQELLQRFRSGIRAGDSLAPRWLGQ